MHYGYRIVEDMIQGLSDYLDRQGMRNPSELVGRALPHFGEWGALDPEVALVAEVHPKSCVGCNLCVVACDDGGHQCMVISPEFREDGLTRKAPTVDEEECVGCNLCMLVCPAPGAITMKQIPYEKHYHGRVYGARGGGRTRAVHHSEKASR
jgi:dihydropyrimidine dehydrogenase (NAD+) subunit PreA